MTEFLYYKCQFCGETNPEYIPNCPVCMRTGAMVRPDYVPVALGGKTPVLTLEEAEMLDGVRVDTNIAGVNRVLGTNRSDDRSGLFVPGTTLFAGGQGCGKTTLLLQVLALIKTRSTLLLSSEQSLPEIKSSLVGIGLEEKASRIKAYSLLDDDCRLSVAMEKINAVNPKVLVIDSINELADDLSVGRDQLTKRVRIIRHFKADAEQNNRAIILTAHLTKDDSVAGKREQLHVASTVMLLERLDSSRRLLHCPEKNRFGDTSQKAYFRMTRHGLVEIEGAPDAAKVK